MLLSLACGRYLVHSQRPLIMGILNLTPDSFSDGGRYSTIDTAIHAAYQMINDGADIIDIGAESTRPGATPISLQEELDRLLPIVKALQDCGRPLSIDTYKPEVMRAALEIGVDIINDIHALRMPGATDAVADSDCAVILMHMQGNPQNMQSQPCYENVVSDTIHFFQSRLDDLEQAKVNRSRIMLDPGFGFGKTLAHNLALLKQLSKFKQFDLPILVGLSRKSMLGELTGKPIAQREFSSIAAALFAVEQNAAIVRVHNVPATQDALKIWAAVHNITWQDNVTTLTADV
jgi:dihydropteroate synthase